MFHIFVDEIPSCEECPFYIRDDNKECLGKEVYRCYFKFSISTAQYGGMDLVEELDERECPWRMLPCLTVSGKCPTCKCRCGC